MPEKIQLYYHNLFAGRGEFVRLVLEEIGVPYEQVQAADMKAEIAKLPGFPPLAPPVLKTGDFQLAQSGVICQYLAHKYGLEPEAEDDKWHAVQVQETLSDLFTEGSSAYHAIDPYGAPTGGYDPQSEALKPYLKTFAELRIPKFLKYFESILEKNNGGQGFMFGNKITYVDLAMFHVMRALEASYSADWAAADYCPLLKAFKDRIAARPNIAAYLNSPRAKPMMSHSMM